MALPSAGWPPQTHFARALYAKSQNPWPKPPEKSKTQSRRIRDPTVT